MGKGQLCAVDTFDDGSLQVQCDRCEEYFLVLHPAVEQLKSGHTLAACCPYCGTGFKLHPIPQG